MFKKDKKDKDKEKKPKGLMRRLFGSTAAPKDSQSPNTTDKDQKAPNTELKTPQNELSLLPDLATSNRSSTKMSNLFNFRKSKNSPTTTTTTTEKVSKTKKGDEKKNKTVTKEPRRKTFVVEKKGKKPKDKKIEREVPVFSVGEIKRVKNDFFPANVDFKFTSPKENFISCLGQNKSLLSQNTKNAQKVTNNNNNDNFEIDFGDSARVILSSTDY